MSELMRKIGGLSEKYMKNIEYETLSYILAEGDRFRILSSWWMSLIFFFDRVFYLGRRDDVSSMFERAAIKALEELLGATDEQKLDKLLSLRDLRCLEYTRYQKCPDLYDQLKSKYHIQQPDGTIKMSSTGKERDREMTVDTLRFVAENLEKHDYNLVKYAISKINNHEIKKLYDDLVSIRQIGDKTATLFLRDTVAVYDLENQIADSDYILLQPIDTWVRKVSEKLKLAPRKTPDKQLKNVIIRACINEGFSPIKFNQGIWYLGFHSLELILDGFSL